MACEPAISSTITNIGAKDMDEAEMESMPDILLVEDNDGHARLVEAILREAGIGNTIYRFANGQDALDYVECAGKYTGRANEKPFVLLADIDLPRVDGFELLKRLRIHQSGRAVPIMILTLQQDPEDIRRFYEQGCNDYLCKWAAFSDTHLFARRVRALLSLVPCPTVN